MSAATTWRLTRSAFAKWLEAKPEGFVFEDPASCYDCPIACFLRDSGAPDPYVWFDQFTREEWEQRFRPLPHWGKFFSTATAEHRGELTREIALEILAEAD